MNTTYTVFGAIWHGTLLFVAFCVAVIVAATVVMGILSWIEYKWPPTRPANKKVKRSIKMAEDYLPLHPKGKRAKP